MEYQKENLWQNLGITTHDIREAILGSGEISAFTSLLHEALGELPVLSLAALETPQALPPATYLLESLDTDLKSLLTTWLTWPEGKEHEKPCSELAKLILVEVASYGRHISGFMEKIIDEVKPDVLVLDAPPITLRSNMLYAFSLPCAVGLPGYAEMRFASGRPYASETFYPGNMREVAIVKSWQRRIPLIPVGMPRALGHPSLKTADEDIQDEESTGLSLQTAYQEFDDSLKSKPNLEQELRTSGISLSLRNSVSIPMYNRWQEEARYIASRIMEIAALLGKLGRKTKLLAIVDIKHYQDIERNLSLLSQGIMDEVYLPPISDIAAAMLLEMHYSESLNGYAREYIPETTPAQRIFAKAFNRWSQAKQKELLTENKADELISLIGQATRNHSAIVRGTSVRGTIALREVLDGICQIEPGLTRGNLERAALISLPSRISLKSDIHETKASIVSGIVKEILYDIQPYNRVIELRLPDKGDRLSPQDAVKSLEKLIKENNKSARSKGELVIGSDRDTGPKLVKMLEAKGFLKKTGQNQYYLTQKARDIIASSLGQRLKGGKISEEEFKLEKSLLDEMLSNMPETQLELSKKEMAETIMEFMDVLDKQIEEGWGKNINFLRMHSYYEMKASSNEAKVSPEKLDYYHLRKLIDYMEKRGFLGVSIKDGDHTLTGAALDFLLTYFKPRDLRLKYLKTSFNTTTREQLTERGHEIRRYSSGDVFRDISLRHTLKEVARKQKELGDIRKYDLRVYTRNHRRVQTDIVLSIDTSGSMGEMGKMIYARLAAAMLAELALANEDRIGVVTFDDLGQTTLPMESQNRKLVSEYIVSLSAVGATNIGDGIKCATELLFRETNHNRKHIILITDGQPTVISEKTFTLLSTKKTGDLTEESALLETRTALARGVTISVIHVTDDKNTGDEFVKSIAEAGKGQVTTITCSEE